MKLSNTKTLSIFCTVILVILGGLLVFLIYDIQSKNRETSELLHKIEESSENELLYQSVRSIQNSAEEELAALEDIIVSSSELVSLIEEVEQIGRESGLTMDIVSVDEVKVVEGEPQKVRITFDARGSWTQTFSALSIVENIPRKIMIEEVKLNKEDVGWLATVSFAVYISE